MTYTTWGYMSHSDIQEVMEDHDMGTFTVHLDDTPEWFDMDAVCPCGSPVIEHDSVQVGRASGEVEGC